MREAWFVCLTVALTLRPAFAHAGSVPRFVSPDAPELAEMASAAWEAAAACTGRSAPASRRVPITLGHPSGGFGGRAHISPERGGLYLIEVETYGVKSLTIAHEVSHAWVHEGPPALVEGATDLLTDCVCRYRPDLFPPRVKYRAGGLVALEDLRRWSNSESSREIPRESAYVASYRMFVALSSFVPERSLWRTSWSWSEFEETLSGAGPMGAYIRDALVGGVDGQQVAFGDSDEDGVPGVEEFLLGTSPDIQDSDGDGWWDGTPPQVLADGIRLPSDGTPVCVGRPGSQQPVARSGSLGSNVPVELTYWLNAQSVPAPQLEGALPAAGDVSFAVSTRPYSKGVQWALLQGLSHEEPLCWSSPGWTVIAGPSTAGGLREFVAALPLVDSRADAVLGEATHRGVVLLGDANDGDAIITRLNSGIVDDATRGVLSWEYLAALAVASERLRPAPFVRGDGIDTYFIEALARQLARGKPLAPVLAPDLAGVRAAEARLSDCPGGWKAFRAGECRAD